MLAVLYVGGAMMLFGGLASTLLPDGALPYSIVVGLLAAAVATWFTGQAMNGSGPQRKIDEWQAQRRQQLDELVASGRFMMGPGQPPPTSLEEARQQADWLFDQESAQARRALNQHTLFFIPMQYFAFVFAIVAVIVLIIGVVGSITA